MTIANPLKPRRALLALFMLAVLLATLAGAWWFQQRAQRRVQAGSDIVRDIRAQGLGAFWPEALHVDWYLARSGKQEVGWRADVVARIDSDRWSGMQLDVRPKYQAVQNWELNRDATVGIYHGQVGTRQAIASDTSVVLEDGAVKVSQQKLLARSPAPPNYLPEGTFPLALRLAAQRRTAAQFRMVFDEVLNRRGQVEFGTETIEHVGPAKGPGGQDVRRVRAWAVRGDGQSFEMTYDVDDKGRLVRIAGDETELVPVTLRELIDRFGPVDTVVRRLLPGEIQQRWDEQETF